MAKMTLLEIVQDILSSMKSDNVNSINDTSEAQDVARIVKSAYYEIINDRYHPHLNTLVTLTASGNSSRPTHMIIPDNVQRIEWIKYDKHTTSNTDKQFKDVIETDPKDFLDYIMLRDESDSDVETITDLSGVPLLIYNNRAPEYWTTFDDENIVFDAYDNTVDSTLQESKTQVQAYIEATWDNVDEAYPDLPSKAFPYLLAEAKSTAFVSLKQTPNAKEEQKSRRQRTFLAREKRRRNGFLSTPDYGRK